MKQSKDALSIIKGLYNVLYKNDPQKVPTADWKENLMDDVRKQPPPKKYDARIKKLLILFLLVACIGTLCYFLLR